MNTLAKTIAVYRSRFFTNPKGAIHWPGEW